MNVKLLITISVGLLLVGCGKHIAAAKEKITVATITSAAPTPTPTPPPAAGGGTGGATPKLTLTPSIVDFGTVSQGTKVRRTVTVKNTSSSVVGFSSASASTGLVAIVTGGTCDVGSLGYGTSLYAPTFSGPYFSLDPGAECTYILEWTATYENLVYPSENLAVILNGANTQYQSALKGQFQ